MRNFTPPGALSAVNRGSSLYFSKKTILSLLAFFIYAAGYAQNRTPEEKIDPAFQFVLSQPKSGERQIPKTFSPAFKITPDKVVVAAGKPAEERYDCIVYTSDASAVRNAGVVVNSVLPHFVTAWATLEQIEQLSQLSGVNYIAAPTIDELHNDVAVASSGASLLHQGKLNNTVYKGKGVIVAIFDTGIDWKHPDFRDPVDTTKSRILRIWDQTLTAIAGEAPPAGFSLGVEYTQAHINDELDGTPAGYVRESDINGHGTHVAGTAAGNGMAIPDTRKHAGMAPEADIVVIKGGNGSFSESNVINAITYLKSLATALGKPVVLNLSLGGHSGAHDGSRSYEVTIDDFTSSAPGRAVVVSAGNDNGSNIHNQLSIAGMGSGSVTLNVPSSSLGADVFQYRVYLDDNSDVSALVTAPAGGGSLAANAGQFVSGTVLSNGFNVFLRNLTDVNGDRYLDVYISRVSGSTATPAGAWTLTITNNTGNNLSLHGWLWYRNSTFAATSLVGGNSNYLVSSPGNANSAITVASYAGRPSWYTYAALNGYYGIGVRMDSISTFSNRGPRRDGVQKPEIAAIGQHVISALSSASPVSPTDITLPGRYRKNQGTSMSAPVVTGAVALLLQANPATSITQLRTALFSTASKDVLTELPGATPNTTWGYGRLDVYKAASSTFVCAPADRKTYQYDASNWTNQDNGTTLTINRVAVRFTPDITGNLAGAFFHPSTSKASLKMEVRADNSGEPGTLLGTVNVPDTSIGMYSWNYVDLSALNIPVTSGDDYFVVVYRDPASAANWSLRRENVSLDNRSLISANGVFWTNPNYDYKIRSVVYSNQQLAAGIATANTEAKRKISANNLFVDNNCQLIAQLSPDGANPVTDTVTANVWIETGVPQHNGKPFVARHYQLTPKINAASATGKVTLYFTQAEFDAFNADPNSTFDLPTGPSDDAGKSSLLIAKYAGSSSDGSGLPASYSSTSTVINPADTGIIWNAAANRWEVSFAVSGFSGFFVQTDLTPLPLYVESFSGYPQESANVLNWKVSCHNSEPVFDIQRSANGVTFSSIGTTTAINGCNQTFNYKDREPLSGRNYYRIRISDNGAEHYTRSILLQTDKALATTLYPNILKRGESVQVVFTDNEGTLRVMDATGRLVFDRVLTKGVQSITLPISESGPYFYNILDRNGKLTAGKLIVH